MVDVDWQEAGDANSTLLTRRLYDGLGVGDVPDDDTRDALQAGESAGSETRTSVDDKSAIDGANATADSKDSSSAWEEDWGSGWEEEGGASDGADAHKATGDSAEPDSAASSGDASQRFRALFDEKDITQEHVEDKFLRTVLTGADRAVNMTRTAAERAAPALRQAYGMARTAARQAADEARDIGRTAADIGQSARHHVHGFLNRDLDHQVLKWAATLQGPEHWVKESICAASSDGSTLAVGLLHRVMVVRLSAGSRALPHDVVSVDIATAVGNVTRKDEKVRGSSNALDTSDDATGGQSSRPQSAAGRVTAIALCALGRLPNRQHKESNGPALTAVLVGLSSGHVIAADASTGIVLLCLRIHRTAVTAISVRASSRASGGAEVLHAEDVSVAFEGGIVARIDGFVLASHLASVLAHVSSEADKELVRAAARTPIEHQKWKVVGAGRLHVVLCAGRAVANPFDDAQQNGTVFRMLCAGDHPLLCSAVCVEGAPEFSAAQLAANVASKMQTVISSIATSSSFHHVSKGIGTVTRSVGGVVDGLARSFGFGSLWGGSSARAAQDARAPEEAADGTASDHDRDSGSDSSSGPSAVDRAMRPANSVRARRSLADAGRRALRIALAPSARLAAVADSLGRVLLVETVNFFVVRMWKGVRDAEVAFFGSASAEYLAIHAPRRGVVEVWRCRHGEKVRLHKPVVSVRYHVQLCPAQDADCDQARLPNLSFFAGYIAALLQVGHVHVGEGARLLGAAAALQASAAATVPACFVLAPNGTLRRLAVQTK